MIFDTNGNAYFIHPIFIQYASDKYGNIFEIKKDKLENIYNIFEDESEHIYVKNGLNNTYKISLDQFISKYFIERNNILLIYSQMYDKNLIHQINALKINLNFDIN